MRVYDLEATVAEVTAYNDLEGSVISAGDLAGDLDCDVLSDAILETAVQIRDSTVQAVDLELWVNGEFVERANVQGDMTVERDYDNVTQGWTFSCPLTTPDGVFGTPFLCIGPPMGRNSIDIKGIYAFPGREVRIPLITDGIVDNSHREASDSGIIENFTGVDRAGRFDGVKITKQFPPGHGLHRGRVGREIMRSAGETQVDFEDGAQMAKEIQIVDGEPFPILAEIFETENRKLLWDSDGYATNPQVGRVRPDEEIRFSFEERDLLRVAAVSLDSIANVVTLVIANGTRQKTQEDCGLVYTTETEFFYESPYTMRRSNYLQATDGSYTTLTPNTPITDDPVLVRKVETRTGKRCDTLVHEVVKVWEMCRIEIPRHRWNDNGSSDPADWTWDALACYTDDNDGVGGGPAYSDDTEVFRLVSISQTFRFFIAQGYGYLPSGASTGGYNGDAGVFSWADAIDLPPASGYKTYPQIDVPDLAEYGQAIGSVTFFAKLGHIEGAVKERDTSVYPFPLWEDTPPADNREIWGNGTGVNSMNSYLSILSSGFLRTEGVDDSPRAYDTIMPWSISANVFYGDAKQFQTREDEYSWEWAAPIGDRYYYSEDTKRGEESQSLRLVRSVIKEYKADKNIHDESETTIDHIEGTTRQRKREGLSGHGPAIERLDQVVVNEDIYEDGEQEDLAKPTKRTETEQVTVTVPFAFFLTCHMPREVTVEFPWAENEDELRKMAEMLAQESAAMPVLFTLPAHFLIREAHPIHLLYRPFAIDHDIRVKKVSWKRSPNQPLLTSVEARLYGW